MDNASRVLSVQKPATVIWVYDIYRLILITLLYLMAQGNKLLPILSTQAPDLFLIVLTLYFILSLSLTISRQYHRQLTTIWLILSGLIDILCINLLILLSGDITYGVLLIVMVAAQSILSPGKLCVSFAALATLVLLTTSWLKSIVLFHQIDDLFYVGILGAGLFATALTTLFLANKVRDSTQLAQKSSGELADLQRINAFIIERFYSGVIFIDSDGAIKLINHAACSMLRWEDSNKPNYIEEMSIAINDKLTKWRQQPDYFHHSKRAIIHQPDVMMHLIPVQETDKTPVLIIMEDMAKNLQQVQELKLVSLGRFTTTLAHEIRNPLGAIYHASQLLEENDSHSVIDKKLITIINNNCNKMNTIIKNILQLSRREKVITERLNLIDKLELFRSELKQSTQSEFEMIIDGDKQLQIFFDRNQLSQVLVNLAENSIRYSEVSHLVMTIKVTLKDHLVELLFHDNGVGISPDAVSNIFEPFYTSSRQSTGMGLYIAKELCEINHSKLRLVQAEQGACFKLSFNAEEEILL